MKRDVDLERDILLAIEAHDDPRAFVSFDDLAARSGQPLDQIGYQVGLLHEAGLVVAVDTRAQDDPYGWSADRLTYAGHVHLDAIRDPETWRRAKEGARKIGDFSAETLGELAKAIRFPVA